MPEDNKVFLLSKPNFDIWIFRYKILQPGSSMEHVFKHKIEQGITPHF